MKRLLLLPLLCVFGCAAGAGGDAVIGTALALGASAASRASGQCYAACPTGTSCNPKTGFCDELPCRGRCPEGAYCDESDRIPHCVRLKPLELRTRKPPEAEPAPAAANAGSEL